jgi:hypothetical protein
MMQGSGMYDITQFAGAGSEDFSARLLIGNFSSQEIQQFLRPCGIRIQQGSDRPTVNYTEKPRRSFRRK